MKVSVLGFYDKQNLGDDLFKVVLSGFFKDIENLEPTFVCIDRCDKLQETDVFLVGGGDLVNDYFMGKIRRLLAAYPGIRPPVYGIGLGFPFPQLITPEYLDIFDYIQTRTASVAAQLDIAMPNRWSLAPDIVRALPIAAPPVPCCSLGCKKIAVFLASSMCPGNLDENNRILNKIIRVLDNIASRTSSWWSMNKTYHIYLYSMNTSGTVDDDTKLNKYIYSQLKMVYRRNNIAFVNNPIKPEELPKLFASCYATFCVRFHSHVLSLNAAVPFISLSSTFKVRDLLTTCKMNAYSQSMTVEPATLVPVDFDADNMVLLFDKMNADYNNIKTSMKAMNAGLGNIKYLIGNLVYYQPRYIFPRIDHILKKLSKYLHTRDFSTVKDIEYLARVITFTLTRSEQQPFTWGLEQNLLKGQSVSDAVQWLLKNVLPFDKHNLLQSTVPFKNRVYNLEYFDQDILKGIHRSGWQYVVNNMKPYHNPNGIIFDSYLDKTFGWNSEFYQSVGILPFRKPWTGVFHHLPNADYDRNNLDNIINSQVFQKSLKYCQGIVVLSEYLAGLLRDKIKNIRVLHHPTEMVDRVWTVDKFIKNPDKKVVQVGAWLRDTFAIFALPQPSISAFRLDLLKPENDSTIINSRRELEIALEDDYLRDGNTEYQHEQMIPIRKCALKGKHMDNYYPAPSFLDDFQKALNGQFNSQNKGCTQICRYDVNKFVVGLVDNVKRNLESVEIIECLGDDEYDTLLSENVVFLRLVDASACNTIIECIVRNTPIVVNKLPAVVEYLGADYPLYYNTLEDAYELLSNPKLIVRAHYYLAALDKSFLHIDNFLGKL